MSDTEQTVERLATAEVARRLGLTPARVRQIAATGALTYETTPLGRLFDGRSVETLRTAREQRANQTKRRKLADPGA
jgi:hypothetical protein